MAVEFKSEFFDDITDLIGEKDILLKWHNDRKKILEDVRNFVNGIPSLTEEEAEEEGRTEITNHMMGHKNISQIETQTYGIYSNSNTLIDITVDTDNAELDYKLSLELTQIINLALYSKGKFGNVWRSVSGEMPMAAVAPLTFQAGQGWCPRMAPNMLFPQGTGYIAEDVTYAFAPREMTLADLKKLRNSVKGEESKFINVSKIDEMIEALKEQIKTDSVGSKASSEDDREFGGSVLEEAQNHIHKQERKTRLKTWWYYEVVNTEAGIHVSATLFTEAMAVGKTDLKEEIIAHNPKAYDTPEAWLHFIVSDSEIGGVKVLDTARGIAELTYNSDVDREEMLNMIIEGTKERAKPKYQADNSGNIDRILQWNPAEDSVVPDGIKEFKTSAPTGDLFAPFQILGQNSANLSSGSISNVGRGGETRNQTLERQQNTGEVKNNRTADIYKNLDMLLAEIVYRFLAMPLRRGTEGWRDIAWVRACLDEKIEARYGVDYKKLAEKRFGQFKFLTVKARRALGDGSRQEEIDISNWLMDHITSYEPALRPMVIHKATATITKDPDLADTLVRRPDIVINAEKVVAENEYDLIRRRAALGELISIGVDDIHQDHLAVHLKDLQAHLAQAQIVPWTRLDVLQFAAMVEHAGEHLQVLLSNPLTNEEAKLFTQQLQQTVQASAPLVRQVEEQEGSQNSELTPKEQADIQLKMADIELRSQKLGLDFEAFNELVRSREQRHALASRSQYTREINEARRLQIQEQQIAANEKDDSPNNGGDQEEPVSEDG